jgi:hypothetical protein
VEQAHDSSKPQLSKLPVLQVATPTGTPNVDGMIPIEQKIRRRWSQVAPRAAWVLLAMWLFIAAIATMKTGAGFLAPTLSGSTFTDSASSTLGFGWIGAMLVMSGSPIAVSSLVLLNESVISIPESLTMLTGSRMGASFVVLTVAFAYALRGKLDKQARNASLSIGVFTVIMTAIVYIPALLISLPLLGSGALDSIASGSSLDGIDSFVSMMTQPIVDAIVWALPNQIVFVGGLLLLLGSIRLIDQALPEADDAAQLDEHTDWRSRKWIMFGLGSLVALVTMSVSVALTVLVPAVAKGHFRRRQVLPYIMGANITTLGDTLLTAFIIGDPSGVHVVLAELVAITSITFLLLAFFYGPLSRGLVRFTDFMLESPWRIGISLAALLAVPIVLVSMLP